MTDLTQEQREKIIEHVWTGANTFRHPKGYECSVHDESCDNECFQCVRLKIKETVDLTLAAIESERLKHQKWDMQYEPAPCEPYECDFCGKKTDGKLILRDTRIEKKDGSDIVLCSECLSSYAAGEYDKIKLKAPSETTNEVG